MMRGRIDEYRGDQRWEQFRQSRVSRVGLESNAGHMGGEEDCIMCTRQVEIFSGTRKED